MGEPRRLATLTAFAAIGELSAQDDVLDHLDTILDEIDGRAAARERKRKLQIAGVIDQAALRLADACTLVLDDTVSDPDLRDMIIAAVGREPLREAVRQLREHTRPVEEGHRERLLGSYGTVRRFLALLLDTTQVPSHRRWRAGARRAHGARADRAQARARADDVAMQIVSRSWRRLVKPEPGKINRHAYTFCALEVLREGLHRRDLFVRRSDRWGDPRSVLLPDRAGKWAGAG